MTLPPPLPPLPPPLVLPAQYTTQLRMPVDQPRASSHYKLEKLGRDALRLQCNTTLTRADAFRLIGELERLAGTL